MPAKIDMIGKTFGRLTVVSRASDGAKGGYRWNCICSCGRSAVCGGSNLRKGHSKSCGCFRAEHNGAAAAIANKKHGLYGIRPYRIWRGMLERCRNSKSRGYARYGGRGIKVFGPWWSFEKFYADFGSTDPGAPFTIDRIDNDGNYEPGNVRWATMKQQANNRHRTRRFSTDGVEKTYGEWAALLGKTVSQIEHSVHKHGRLPSPKA